MATKGQKFGRYEVQEELGRGGMATVYRAYDPQFKRTVAIKLLPREFMHNPDFKQRFEREARALASLEHPAIVPVYDFGEDDGQPYLVMRHMGGGSLSDVIASGPMKPAEVARIIKIISAGLDEAHKRAIIHRDLKPGNILFDEYGNPYVSDFGLVKIAEGDGNLTGSGIVGTPAYMAPEMATKSGVTPLIDVYAIGVTVYQMLTGVAPYQSDTPMGAMMAHMTEPIPNIYDSAKIELPEGLQEIIERGMAKDPIQRYQSAGELADDLVAVLAGGEVSSRPATGTYKAVRARAGAGSKLPVWVWGAAGVAGLVVLGGVIALVAGGGLSGKPAEAAVTPTPDYGAAISSQNVALIEPVHQFTGHTKTVTSLKWSPDGSKLASSSADTTAILWDASTGSQLEQLKGHTNWVTGVAWSPDGKQLVTSSSDRSVVIWNANGGDQVKVLGTKGYGLSSVDWSPLGVSIGTGAYYTDVLIWDLETGEQRVALKEHTDWTNAFVYSPDGLKAATGSKDTRVIIWDMAGNAPLQRLTGHTNAVLAVAWSPDGKKVISGSQDFTAKIWNVETGLELKSLEGHTQTVTSVAWSPVSDVVATGSLDRTVILWDAKSGTALRTFDTFKSGVYSLAFSPDGLWLAVGAEDGTIMIFGMPAPTS